MTSPSPLERLAGPGNVLTKEPPDAKEFAGLVRSGLGPEVWRILSKCHDMRNRTEYEGVLDVDDRLVSDLIGACRKVAEKVSRLPPIPQESK